MIAKYDNHDWCGLLSFRILDYVGTTAQSDERRLPEAAV